MRYAHKTAGICLLWGLGGAMQLAGCGPNPEDCSRNNECLNDGTPYTDPGLPAECEKSPSEDATVLQDKCGLFVDAMNGDDKNPGTEAAPLKTLQKAIDAKPFRIYACGTFDERISVAGGMSILGGFDCMTTEWTYDAKKRTTISPSVAPLAGKVQASLRVTGGTLATQLEDLVIAAPDAVIESGSSIAVIVDGAKVNFVRTELNAGRGAAGEKPAPPAEPIGPMDPTDASIRGNDGQMACMGGAAGNPGGAAKGNTICPESIGGAGGNGKGMLGEKGSDGLPIVSGYGAGGAGEGAIQCMPGAEGANGPTGPDGSGAVGPGSLDATKGYSGGIGSPGSKGITGQGGGGGGGARGNASCYGASGGSGGAGGCGGNGGLGGTPGGASLGLVSINATMSFQDVTIARKEAGAGGDGGDGQYGAVGGNGGLFGAGNMGLVKACAGGAGGTGGNGGQGGGGTGGHSVGITFKGTAPVTTGITFTPPPANAAGAGGKSAVGKMDGASGVVQDVLEIP